MTGIKNIILKLGLSERDGLFLMDNDHWKTHTSFPNRVKRLIENRIEPQAFFCFDNKPLILFFENPSDKEKLYETIWNFNESPIVIIIENDNVEIFNGFNFLKDKKTLEKLGGIEKLNDFSYFELVTGRAWEQYEDHLNYKNRVDYYLLQNINAARKILVQEQGLSSKVANALIGKVIFVRYLIDREVKLCFEGDSKYWTNNDFCELLNNPQNTKNFFDYLENSETGFNGDLFPLHDEEYNQVQSIHYNTIRRLIEGDDLDKQQPSLFEFYDFSIIPIEFISNVYELFIGKDNQEEEGAYYTPLFLVDYILKETVDKKLNNGKGYSCKVLDPACGSGVFLVETLRKIIEKYIASGVDAKSEDFKAAIKEIVKENIYGVDKDLSAVQVAIFSIYLTLLDYLEPPEIESFKFPILLHSNFFEADFFDTKASFNELLSKIEFEYILGNPPWMRGKGEKTKPLYVKYVEARRKEEKYSKILPKIGNKEIAQAFLLRSSDFSSQNTKCALIVTSKTLYNLQSDTFRKYFLDKFFIKRIFELAPVRKEVFDKSNDKAVAPACVLFFNYSNNESTDFNIIEHITLKPSRFFSLFKIFTINKTDYKKIQQSKLKQYDWLWKVLVYGSYLDFNFINRLKTEFVSIKDFISDADNFVEGTGIQYSSEEPYDATHLNGLPFIDSYGITPFFINPDKISVFNRPKVHRKRDERIFIPPMLLIRKGLDMRNLTAYCAISYKQILFKDSITSVSVINHAMDNTLVNIASLLTSSLFSYYAINTFSSIGIEREQTQSENKYCLPYLELGVKEYFKEIEQAYQDLYEESQKTLIDNFAVETLKNNIQLNLKQIEDIIYCKLELSDLEYTLVDHALNVSRPLIVGNDNEKTNLFSSLSFNDDTLNSYVSLFLDKFQPKFSRDTNKFTIEIWYTKQIIGIFFKVIPAEDYVGDVSWIDKQDESELLTFISKFSTEKVTDRLFIQKDIRGFDNNGDDFFIIKPNEKRLWHKAVGYIDMYEFADAILKAGRVSI
ncbi:N-6 DNA methylase [Dysgonomonas sp. Marseille-Q5470]|uniref:HsdM family class I SAM-dependent methyltransferase n=1 Tax=Dysgonomonas sp. Marseille-Q5470 TaxID=3039494 RepID=UPI0024BD4A70|nr:N-6 DNA methylase [Dysgonomonas sp. Marseille-Q5470]